MSNEHRCHPRFSIHEPVRLWFESYTNAVNGYLVNLSVGGAFVRCSIPAELGRSLKCAFLIDHEASLEVVVCKGTVSWIPSAEICRAAGRGFGMQFTNLPPETRCFLEVVAEERLSDG